VKIRDAEMTKSFEGLSDDKLVQRFAEICVKQDEALLDTVCNEVDSPAFDKAISRFNDLFDIMKDIDDELRKRGLSSRLALTKLYTHSNLQVRLQAARLTLAIAPTDAKQVIEAIVESKRMPQAGDAGMCLWALEQGIFKPT
jgi:hypothetical protein